MPIGAFGTWGFFNNFSKGGVIILIGHNPFFFPAISEREYNIIVENMAEDVWR
jgi:hypothetical protein